MEIVVRDPRTGAPDGQFTAASPAAVRAEAGRLRAAQPAWAARSPAERAALLVAWAARIDAVAPALVAALTRDCGRERLSRLEVADVAAHLRHWAAAAPALLAPAPLRGSQVTPGLRHATRHVPYALCGFLTPWNMPLLMALIDAIPALAAGCAVLIKPSELTPRFVAPLRDTLAGLPELAAVVGLVAGGADTGRAVVDSVDFVCFTGSVAVGRQVAARAARRLIPACLELGGKDPAIVTDSADLDRAVRAIVASAVANSGQMCLAIERIYVDRAVHDAFVDRLVARVAALRLNIDGAAGPETGLEIGPETGFETGPEIGPLIQPRLADTIAAQLADARAKGAHIVAGGHLLRHGGIWCEPTVLTDVTHDMAIMRAESFAPLLPVMAFDTLDEAVALANDSDFGLSAAVFAGTEAEARAIAGRVNAGGISLNACGLTTALSEAGKDSFGHSGLGGSRLGATALYRFTRRQALFSAG